MFFKGLVGDCWPSMKRCDIEMLESLANWRLSEARAKQLTPLGLWRVWLLLSGRGFGKALALDTLLPTPRGWTSMGAVQVGDELFDEKGNRCRVTAVHPIRIARPCYRVVFDDGAEIVADEDHLWETWDKKARKAAGRARNPRSGPRVRTTKEIAETLRVGPRRETNHSIVVSHALQPPISSKLPLNPYVLGYWLGDGSVGLAEITAAGEDADFVVEVFKRAGYSLSSLTHDQRTRDTLRLGFGTTEARVAVGYRGFLPASLGTLSGDLQRAGVRERKHIPASYLRASPEERRELLRGLMDADGYATPGGHVELCLCDRELAEDAFELILSLGYKAVWAEGKAALYGKDCGLRFRITWTPHDAVFGLSRKKSRQNIKTAQRTRTTHRYIVSCEPTPSVPVRCITVDSPSSLYLAGQHMVPTHNTRTAVEDFKAFAWSYPGSRLLVSAPTFADARDICFEGESGLVSKIPKNCVEDWNRSIGELILVNGSRFDLLSADQPERVRGRQYHRAWADELASYKGQATGKRDATGAAIAGTPDQMFAQIRLATRLRSPVGPRILVTTTPKVLKILKELRSNPRTYLTTGSTFENRDNLAEESIQDWIDLYEGTRLGRQELYAEILEEIEGALWTRMMLEEARLDPKKDQLPAFRRVVIAVDPAVTANKRSNETGIVAVGLTAAGRAVVLQDGSGKYTPDQWADKAIAMYESWNASRIVGEVNNGGDMVENIMRSKAPNISYKAVNAVKGKIVRAEPVAHLYERKLVDHWGAMPVLEDQLCSYTGEEGEESPDHMDALVWALTELCLTTKARPLVAPVGTEATNHFQTYSETSITADSDPITTGGSYF